MESDYDSCLGDAVTDAVVAVAADEDGVVNGGAVGADVALVDHAQEPSWDERDHFDLT